MVPALVEPRANGMTSGGAPVATLTASRALAPDPLRVAYLVNVYPAVSHTFIRREILAMERQGLVIERMALRVDEVVDEQDVRERERTRYLLSGGKLGLLSALVRESIRNPRNLLCAARSAFEMSRSSDRAWYLHLAYLAEACVLAKWQRDLRIDHLHAHFATNPAEVAMLAHHLTGVPYSFTGHGSDISDRPTQVGFPLTIRQAAFVVAVCAFGRSQMCKWVPAQLWSRIHVVRCGLDADHAGAAAVPAPQGHVLCCVGRLSAEKGQLVLVEALALLSRRGQPVSALLVGDGPMGVDIQTVVRSNDLSDQVTLLGAKDAAGVRAAMLAARALVVPSLSEGLPVVIMEAMALGRPVIAPYLAGIPELVTHGETGWLYPAGDVDALAGAIEACLATDAHTLDEMGRKARLAVTRAHNIDTEAAKLADLFRLSAQRDVTPTRQA